MPPRPASLILLLPSFVGGLALQAGEPFPAAFEVPDRRTVDLQFQARARGEWRENLFDFDNSVDAATDDLWLLHRLRVGLDWEASSWLRVTVQGQDVRESFSDRPDTPNQLGAEGDDPFDLRLASVELGFPDTLSVKVGRQTLAYGDERLVGPLEWLNFSRVFDAAKLHYRGDTWWLEAFASSVVNIDEARFNQSDWLDPANPRQQTFSGLYLSGTFLPHQLTDFYLFHLSERGAQTGADFLTFGTCLKGDPRKLSGWDYTVEIAGQRGTARDQDLAAFAAHLQVGYNWLGHPWEPRVAMEYSHGSGDRDPGDGQIQTFQNLFPTNHPPYGLMDTLAWQNLHNVVLRLAAKPHSKVRTTLDFHAFWLDHTTDAWYRANGITQVRSITPQASNQAGAEIDFTLSTKLSEHLDLLAGYSHFFAGSYLDDTGAGDDAHFAYLMVTLVY